MSRRFRTTVQADSDIRTISQWIARDSIRTALKWVDDLDREFLKIVQTPGIGTDRSDLRPQLRSVPFGNYLVFFKSSRNGVIVVRIIHGARDYARLFDRK